MSFKYLPSSILMLFLFTTAANAQLTITASDFANELNKTKTITQYICEPCEGISSLIELKGENRIWDFSSVPFEFAMSGEHGVNRGVKSPIDTDHVVTHTKFWSLSINEESEGFELNMTDYFYLVVDANEVYVVAEKEVAEEVFGDESEAYSSSTRYESKLLAYQFPISFGSNWESESMSFYIDDEMSTESETMIYWSSTVDGWGTLQTNYGTTVVLRIHQTEYRTSRLVPSREIYSFVDKNGTEHARIEFHVGVHIVTVNEFD